MTDASLKPDPTRKGSYYRRIDDIGRALKALCVPSLPPGPKFVAYFFASEKLAHAIVGIADGRPAISQFHPFKKLKLADVKKACGAMKLRITDAELEWIFADHREQHLLAGGFAPASARMLRNNLSHDFGPTNAEKLVKSATVLIPMMERLLNCTPAVLAYLRANFAHVA